MKEVTIRRKYLNDPRRQAILLGFFLESFLITVETYPHVDVLQKRAGLWIYF